MDNSSSTATKPVPSTSGNSTDNANGTSNVNASSSLSSSSNAVTNTGGGGGDYSLGSGSSSVDHHSLLGESHGQHQIVTTVTSNRQSTSNSSGYGGNLSSSGNANGSLSSGPSSSSNSYKLKQQRNYQTNRFDPMAGQSGGGGGGGGGGYQARNAANAAAAAAAAAAQLQQQQQQHHPWANPNVLGGPNASSYPTNLAANAFALPPHYSQQTVDMYANYYGATGASPYAPHPSQHSAYGQYGQSLVPQESPKGGHVIYVYGIGQKATQEEIFALFQPFGRVLRVDIIIDFNTGLCKGYAFVAMEQYQDAQMAIQSLNAAPFHGRQLQVRFKS